MNKKIPMRLCVGCGQMKVKKDLLRIVKCEDNSISLDITGKKNGRGAYICKDASCFEQAKKKKGLERSLKGPVASEIYDSLIKEFDHYNESKG